MQRPAGSGGVCRHCKGEGVVRVRTKGGEERRRCAACGGSGSQGYRTK